MLFYGMAQLSAPFQLRKCCLGRKDDSTAKYIPCTCSISILCLQVQENVVEDMIPIRNVLSTLQSPTTSRRGAIHDFKSSARVQT